MEKPILVWENEGGAVNESLGQWISGTANQIEWANQIKAQVDAEFDRVEAALQDGV